MLVYDDYGKNEGLSPEVLEALQGRGSGYVMTLKNFNDRLGVTLNGPAMRLVIIEPDKHMWVRLTVEEHELLILALIHLYKQRLEKS